MNAPAVPEVNLTMRALPNATQTVCDLRKICDIPPLTSSGEVALWIYRVVKHFLSWSGSWTLSGCQDSQKPPTTFVLRTSLETMMTNWWKKKLIIHFIIHLCTLNANIVINEIPVYNCLEILMSCDISLRVLLEVQYILTSVDLCTSWISIDTCLN